MWLKSQVSEAETLPLLPGERERENHFRQEFPYTIPLKQNALSLVSKVISWSLSFWQVVYINVSSSEKMTC
jgi:hypothetical protein